MEAFPAFASPPPQAWPSHGLQHPSSSTQRRAAQYGIWLVYKQGLLGASRGMMKSAWSCRGSRWNQMLVPALEAGHDGRDLPSFQMCRSTLQACVRRTTNSLGMKYSASRHALPSSIAIPNTLSTYQCGCRKVHHRSAAGQAKPCC